MVARDLRPVGLASVVLLNVTALAGVEFVVKEAVMPGRSANARISFASAGRTTANEPQ